MDQIKDLRVKTNAGISDCKKALAENDGDMEAAVDWLRKKGLASAAKKSGNVAAEGLVGAKVEGNTGVIIEFNSQTDFVAKNEQFQNLTRSILSVALKEGTSIEALRAATFPGTSHAIQDEIVNHIAVIGENLNLRRVQRLSAEHGVVASYLHNSDTAELGKIAVIIALESTGDKAKLNELGRRIAMHIAAAKPEALRIEDVTAENLARERDVLVEQARASGRPENIIEKMVEGRIRKYYEEVVLLEQIFIIDGKTKISDLLEQAAKDIGAPVAISNFALFVLGEGIEKKETDFAAEVAAVMRG
ncbi:MAG: elongation factor Ts [Alphaproteobacteria bacterium]|nr:elongation factor Ts [Alphaproteobacteria bacterium]